MNKVSRRDLLKMFGIGVGVAAVPAIVVAKRVAPPKENVITLPGVWEPVIEYNLPSPDVDTIIIEDMVGNSAKFTFRREHGSIRLSICESISYNMERGNLNPINHCIGSRIEIKIQLQWDTMIGTERFDSFASPFILTYTRGDECIIIPEFEIQFYGQYGNGQMEIIGQANVESTTVRKSGRNSFSPITRYLC